MPARRRGVPTSRQSFKSNSSFLRPRPPDPLTDGQTDVCLLRSSGGGGDFSAQRRGKKIRTLSAILRSDSSNLQRGSIENEMTRPRGQSRRPSRRRGEGAMTIRIDGFVVWETWLAVFHKVPNERVYRLVFLCPPRGRGYFLFRYSNTRLLLNLGAQIGSTHNSHKPWSGRRAPPDASDSPCHSCSRCCRLPTDCRRRRRRRPCCPFPNQSPESAEVASAATSTDWRGRRRWEK